MRQHLDLLGYFYIALGVLGLLAAAISFIVLVGVGLLSGEGEAFAVLGLIGFIAALALSLLSIPNLALAYGLLKRKSWSRPLGLILGVLNLFNAPLGTLLGVYTFWVLLQDETEALLNGRHAV